MKQAAQRKGVSYYTVSRAIRSGRLPHQRLGRQVWVTQATLDAWQPKRERAPHKYRRREPDLGVLASTLTQNSLDRATLDTTVTALATVLIRTAGSLREDQLQEASQALSRIVLDPGVDATQSQSPQGRREAR
jgi:excisionase family DNA binding protein